jgi:hypothetical protein
MFTKNRFFDWLLIVAVLIGGIQTVRSALERSRLSERLARLVRKTGDLRIVDETKVHVKALETDVPLEFAWRFYFPRNYSGTLNERHIGGSTSFAAGPVESIARVRIRHDESGLIRVYNHFGDGSDLTEFVDTAFSELLCGRWNKLVVEQLGTPNVAAINAEQPTVLLRLKLPEDLERTARATLAAEDLARCVPSVLQINLKPATSGP